MQRASLDAQGPGSLALHLVMRLGWASELAVWVALLWEGPAEAQACGAGEMALCMEGGALRNWRVTN